LLSLWFGKNYAAGAPLWILRISTHNAGPLWLIALRPQMLILNAGRKSADFISPKRF